MNQKGGRLSITSKLKIFGIIWDVASCYNIHSFHPPIKWGTNLEKVKLYIQAEFFYPKPYPKVLKLRQS